MHFHRKLWFIQRLISSTWAISIFHFKWVLPFPVKIYPFGIFIRATPGSTLVYHRCGINSFLSDECRAVMTHVKCRFVNTSYGVSIPWIVAPYCNYSHTTTRVQNKRQKVKSKPTHALWKPEGSKVLHRCVDGSIKLLIWAKLGGFIKLLFWYLWHFYSHVVM